MLTLDATCLSLNYGFPILAIPHFFDTVIAVVQPLFHSAGTVGPQERQPGCLVPITRPIDRDVRFFERPIRLL